MNDLDPAAVEAVARKVASEIYTVEWDELAPWQKEAGLHDAAATIRAIDTFRAAAVREAVTKLIEALAEEERGGPLSDTDHAHAALLTLLGVEETE